MAKAYGATVAAGLSPSSRGASMSLKQGPGSRPNTNVGIPTPKKTMVGIRERNPAPAAKPVKTPPPAGSEYKAKTAAPLQQKLPVKQTPGPNPNKKRAAKRAQLVKALNLSRAKRKKAQANLPKSKKRGSFVPSKPENKNRPKRELHQTKAAGDLSNALKKTKAREKRMNETPLYGTDQ
jgi:hypothetical protein